MGINIDPSKEGPQRLTLGTEKISELVVKTLV